MKSVAKSWKKQKGSFLLWVCFVFLAFSGCEKQKPGGAEGKAVGVSRQNEGLPAAKAKTEGETDTGPGGPPGARTLRFPARRDMGLLMVRDWGSTDEQAWTGDDLAKGLVRIPSGKEVSLTVTGEGTRDLTPIEALGPGDIQRLELCGKQFGNKALAHVIGLRWLQTLDLSASSITDDGLALLLHFPALRGLNLLCTDVSDAGVMSLKMLTSLQMLDLRGTKVTDRGFADLERALPHCRIKR